MAAETNDVKIVDARGAYCPGPLMELIKNVRQDPVGTIFEVWSNDSGSAKDIPEWAKRAGHEVLKNYQDDGVFKIQVKKQR